MEIYYLKAYLWWCVYETRLSCFEKAPMAETGISCMEACISAFSEDGEGEGGVSGVIWEEKEILKIWWLFTKKVRNRTWKTVDIGMDYIKYEQKKYFVHIFCKKFVDGLLLLEYNKGSFWWCILHRDRETKAAAFWCVVDILIIGGNVMKKKILSADKSGESGLCFGSSGA